MDEQKPGKIFDKSPENNTRQYAKVSPYEHMFMIWVFFFKARIVSNFTNEMVEFNLRLPICHVFLCSRTFVNLVPSPLINLSFSMDRIQVPWQCHLSRPIECSCLFGPAYSRARTLYRRLERKFVEIMERVSFRSEFHRDDFTVVFQPFFKDASVFLDNDKMPDMTIMSVDCIHLSQKGHAIAANGLWNNMLQPRLHKTTGLKRLFQEFKCPNQKEPYLYTYFNSWAESSIRCQISRKIIIIYIWLFFNISAHWDQIRLW